MERVRLRRVGGKGNGENWLSLVGEPDIFLYYID